MRADLKLDLSSLSKENFDTNNDKCNKARSNICCTPEQSQSCFYIVLSFSAQACFMQCPTCLVKYRLYQNSSLPSFLSIDGFNDGSRRAIDVFLFHFNPIVSTKFIYWDYLFILYHSGNFFYYYHFNQHFNTWKNRRELALYQKKVKFEKFTTFSLLQLVHLLNFTL